MNQIEFHIDGSIMRSHDAAIILDDEDPREALVEAAVQNISTTVRVKAGGVTLHLAAWMDPEHWDAEWREALGDDADVEAFIAGLVTAR